MNNRMNRQTNTMRRLKQFGLDHRDLIDQPAAVAAFAALNDAIARIEALDSTRLHGTNTHRGAAEEGRHRRKLLRSALSDLSRVAKTLDRGQHPSVAAQLKMGRLNSNAELLALARSAITVVTPIKSVFIDHGAPESVLEDLQALIDAFVVSGDRSRSGMGVQINSNVALILAVRDGMRQVRILDGIMHFALKSEPGLMAEWVAAKRIERRFPAQTAAAPEQPATTAPKRGVELPDGNPQSQRRCEFSDLDRPSREPAP